MALATLSIDLVAKLAEFQAGMDKAARLADKRSADIQRSIEGIKSGAVAVGGALVGAFSVATITQFVRATVDSVDALNDVADAIGTTVENASALEDIAVRTGGSLDTVTSILVKFNGVLKEADGKNEVSRVLQAIGLEAEELRRIDPAEALRVTSVALAGFADDGDKARAVQVLLGKSVKEAAPFLKDLAEAGELNAKVTSEQAAEAEKFNKQLFELDANIRDAARSLVSELVPALNRVVKTMRDEGFLALFGFDNQFTAKKNLAAIAAEVVQLNGHLKKLQADQAGSVGFFGNPEKVAAQIADVTRKLEDAKKRFREADAAYFGLTDGAAGGGRGFVNPGAVQPKIVVEDEDKKPKTPRAPSGPGDLGFSFEPDTAAQKRALSLFTDNNVTAAKEYAETLDLLQQSLFDVSADEIPAIEAAIAKLTGTTQQAADTTRSYHDEQQRLAELLGATATAEIERQRKDMLLLAKAFEDGRITVEQFDEAAKTRLGTMPDTLKKSTDAMTVFAEQAGRNIQDALGSTVKDVLKGDFDDIDDKWKDLLANMAAEAIAADLGKLIFGSGGVGSGGGFVGWLGSLFGGATASAKGNAFTPGGLVTAFANGGIVNGATPFTFGGGRLGVMGEAGPEAVMPLKRGRDGKLGVVSQGGGGVQITNVNHFGAGVNRSELAAFGEVVRLRTLQDVQRKLTRGGPLS